MVLTVCRGYIGEFDDLTIEEIKAHPNVSTPWAKSRCAPVLTLAKVSHVEQDEVFEAFQTPSGFVSKSLQSPVVQANATWAW